MKKLVLALVVLGFAACARPIAPEGGPKDTTPPQVVPESSTPNLRTRFTERTFKLTFDEWVTLQDVGTQVLVSPPLAKRPEVSLKGRTVTFKFDPEEVLRENTTYTINFGTAVKDLHENNPAKDLRFVFSTGDVIDSLTVTGIVLDAFSGAPQENMSVQLYDAFEDSIILKERPYYVARSDKSGQFAIPNVRAGRFKAVAIEDADQNLKWNGETERIGFQDSILVVSDSLLTMPATRIFTPARSLRLVTKNVGQYGRISLGFTNRPDTVPVRVELPGLRWMQELDQDSLLIWYDNPDSVAWNLLVGPDTVSVKALSREAFLAANTVHFAGERTATPGGQRGRRGNQTTPAPAAPKAPPRLVQVNPQKPAEIFFNNPIAQVDTARFVLIADSLETRQFKLRLDSVQHRRLQLDINWLAETTYKLSMLPGAVTDFYGTSNVDTLQRNFSVPAEKQLGNLGLSLESLQPGAAYVLHLLSGNTQVEEHVFVADSTSLRLSFQKLQPIAYTVQLIEDRNGNGRWDPGDYFARRQPERVFSKKLEPLRANWEVEAVLQAKVSSGKRRE